MIRRHSPIVVEIHVTNKERKALEAFFDQGTKPIQAVNDGAQAFYRDRDIIMWAAVE